MYIQYIQTARAWEGPEVGEGGADDGGLRKGHQLLPPQVYTKG